MANINQVAVEVAQAEAEAAMIEAAREAQAKENIEELLERRAQFGNLRKAAVTVLMNIDIANRYFDRAANENRDLSLEDTEALLANFDTVGEKFGATLAAASEEYEALAVEVGLAGKTCGCGCGSEDVALAA